MPIKIPDDLPARKRSSSEGVVVMDSSRAARQDIRPLQIGLLNLMPNKERTETQFTRLIGSTPLQVDLTLVRVTDHKSKNTSEDYLKTFYSTWEEVRDRKFDGFIVTGAPIANSPFEEVTYWREMVEIMDWTQTNVHHTMFICWGGRRPPHFHGVRRYRMDKKAFGVFRHRNHAPARRGCAASRTTSHSGVALDEIRAAEIPAGPGLEVLMESTRSASACSPRAGNRLYMFNHLEYDTDSLDDEYDRDVASGVADNGAAGYYPDDDPAGRRSTAGAPTPTCCSATGSTRFTRPRPTTWTTSAGSRSRPGVPDA